MDVKQTEAEQFLTRQALIAQLAHEYQRYNKDIISCQGIHEKRIQLWARNEEAFRSLRAEADAEVTKGPHSDKTYELGFVWKETEFFSLFDYEEGSEADGDTAGC